MLYLIAIVIGVFAGIAAGGRVSNLLEFKIEKVWLIISAFLLQAFIQIAGVRGAGLSLAAKQALFIVSYGMLLVSFWLNRKRIGFIAMGTGCLLNALVIIANGGSMPVSLEILKRANLTKALEAIESGLDVKHAVLCEGTRLAFLSDIIYVPYFPGFLMRVVSIGDLIVVAGLLILAIEITLGKKQGDKASDNQ